MLRVNPSLRFHLGNRSATVSRRTPAVRGLTQLLPDKVLHIWSAARAFLAWSGLITRHSREFSEEQHRPAIKRHAHVSLSPTSATGAFRNDEPARQVISLPRRSTSLTPP